METRRFRSGDKVEIEIQADYYFGGPVANANVGCSCIKIVLPDGR